MRPGCNARRPTEWRMGPSRRISADRTAAAGRGRPRRHPLSRARLESRAASQELQGLRGGQDVVHCPGTLTFRQTRAMVPSRSTRSVARSIPMYLRPYMNGLVSRLSAALFVRVHPLVQTRHSATYMAVTRRLTRAGQRCEPEPLSADFPQKWTHAWRSDPSPSAPWRPRSAPSSAATSHPRSCGTGGSRPRPGGGQAEGSLASRVQVAAPRRRLVVRQAAAPRRFRRHKR